MLDEEQKMKKGSGRQGLLFGEREERGVEEEGSAEGAVLAALVMLPVELAQEQVVVLHRLGGRGRESERDLVVREDELEVLDNWRLMGILIPTSDYLEFLRLVRSSSYP